MDVALDSLESKLSEAGVPESLHHAFVQFHRECSGRRSKFGQNEAIWGILFDSISNKSSAMAPGIIEAFEEEGNWQVVCADIHVSDTATVDQDGRLYWSYKPWYSHYRKYFEGAPPDLRD